MHDGKEIPASRRPWSWPLRPPGRRPGVDRGLLFAAGVVGALLIAGYCEVLFSAGSTNGHRFGSLVDQHGRVFADQAASRGYKLVAFGFTQCPEVCPTTLAKMHRVLEALDPAAKQLTGLFVTVDPTHDTPQALESYTSAFDPRIVGITGRADDVRAFAAAYGVYPPGEQPSGMGEAIGHSAMLYFLGRNNELLAAYRPVVSPDSIAADISARRQRDAVRE
jgi:protein SCO1